MRVLLAKIVTRKTIPFAAGLLVALFGMAISSSWAAQTVHADCSNDIICNGFSTASSFISKVRNNNDGDGHHDLQAIYGFYGLKSADYSKFASQAVEGTAYQDGRVVVNGKTVATNGKSIGRLASMQGSGYFRQPISGNTYYGNTNDKAFASSSLPVMVLFDDTGTMQFAVIKSCGNPEFGTPVPTSASCRELTKTPVSGVLNTYDFTATANTTGNASITKYVFDFGDGHVQTVTSSAKSVTLRHPYTVGGNFTAKVTEFASVPGNNNLQLPVVSNCTKTVTVVLPFYACDSLKPITVDETKRIYQYVATARNGGGAVFTKTDYNFGDNTAIQTVTSTDHRTTTATHTFAENKDYNVSALLHFTVNGKDVTATYKCTANRQTSTCKPGIPVGDVRCNPCPSNPAVPANDTEHCVTEAAVTSLPNTGAGNTIAIFAAVVVAGFLAYRHRLFRRHRAAFLAAQHGVSPLPLGDPLNEDAPLAGTPLAPAKRRSLRRKRQY